MQSFSHIQADAAQQMLKDNLATLADIRDANSFEAAHIEGATHLSNESLSQFMAATDKARPIIVCCYHGISSQQAAQFLVQQGYEQVYSLDGGFEGWRRAFPYVSQG
ncbi:thiosulfate sulfurtransferase GlpE [Bowmanella pacifica]|uniref:Thiosulfate sulfurtransferase GlpE n=1 Tax=Bowmanella pacifica TaxID=502051 RepID=A0A917Z389_9ALTE|nr:thiosulfate sulfurtransferase GlpE [Bowmanella pacifica]GGO71829.1 thiosulfate sulfurtransferase GlpE [Bowmanella pacifica]